MAMLGGGSQHGSVGAVQIFIDRDYVQEQVWDAAMLLTDCLDKVGKGVAELPQNIASTAGSTLEEEHQQVGEFKCPDIYGTLPAISEYSDDLNGSQRLYGGAQLRRVKREVRCVLLSSILAMNISFVTSRNHNSFCLACSQTLTTSLVVYYYTVLGFPAGGIAGTVLA